MTTADLLAADFQLRSSNILVAPLDAAGVYARGDLIVYRACAGAEFFCCNALFTLATEQHDLVPDLDIFVHPEDAGIHRDPSQQRAPLAPDQGLSLSRKRAYTPPRTLQARSPRTSAPRLCRSARRIPRHPWRGAARRQRSS